MPHGHISGLHLKSGGHRCNQNLKFLVVLSLSYDSLQRNHHKTAISYYLFLVDIQLTLILGGSTSI